ncbi:Slam-dependent surface lipoprotein [Photorhabdus bodei]|uniref:Transferrin-binding protein-like solute binding protein n=1 Tax=Photorhabdus bodei TaxID=2029681 RepID=A0AAW6BGI0_9GAMM|nr:Slam-dependent surface lipoprotein [Photorhabdus bodei]MDB6371906.1 transferrin-binding protein-like solute binding protein [Photorhabdus bodei]
MNKVKVLIAVLGTCGLVTQSIAAPGFGQTQRFDENKPSIQVGVTTPGGAGHSSPGGEPGVGINSVANGKIVSFSGLTRYVAADANGIHKISMPGSGSHGGMGVFNFSKVANADVYFGEWSQTGKVDDTTHTAYYSGKDVTTNLPTGGIATYTVKGINQYSGSNALHGTFTADFGQKRLTGSIANSALTVGINSVIKTDGSFVGSATAGGAVGRNSGHFFGDNAASLAGTATFASDHSKDTAFGGTKNP